MIYVIGFMHGFINLTEIWEKDFESEFNLFAQRDSFPSWENTK